jgi:hypothetical protein
MGNFPTTLVIGFVIDLFEIENLTIKVNLETFQRGTF